MKLSMFNENKKVLLVGEGNFSFAVTLAKHNLKVNLTATCYECNVQETGKKNIEILKDSGIRVIIGVDATKLKEHEILSLETFDIVVFNFPHVGGKMRIEKNRELIKQFFISVKSILQIDGRVFMSLCDGQGGTPADTSIRKWNDSWQVTEMAAHGDFLLIAVEPFDSSLFKTYTVTGYRSLQKQFNTHGSLTHIFKLTDRANDLNIIPEKKVDLKMYYNKTFDYKNVFLETNNIQFRRNCQILAFYSNSYKFDITFFVTSEFNIVNFYEILYNHAGLIINNVEYLDSYTFVDSRTTNTFRITYKSRIFPLHRKLVIDIHKNIISKIIEKSLNTYVR